MSSSRRAQECAAFFRGHPAYRRALQEIRNKWKKYGKAQGIVRLLDCSAEEQASLGGFLNRQFWEEAISFKVLEFESALAKTSFSDVSLEELLAAYFREELVTNRVQRERKEEQKRGFFERQRNLAAERFGADSAAARWISQAAEEKSAGYSLLLLEMQKSEEEASRQAEAVCRALELLGGKSGVRLAVLAAEATGNPHAFDRNTSAGKLLLQALAWRSGQREARTAEEIMMLYCDCGIQPDDISSSVAAYGLHFTRDGQLHPAYEGFLACGEPYVVTLSNISRADGAFSGNGLVYAVENQMVFSHLCEAMSGGEAAILCTSGQVSTAGLKLLDLLGRSGCTVFYSGDFDPEGLLIAQRIVSRNPEHTRLWHMGREDYERCVSGEEISGERLKKLEKVTLPGLLEVKEELIKRRRAGYQEKLAEQLSEDIKRYASDREA